MGLLEGKVAFISGGARGQGRSHAVRLAQEGADIVTFDICETIPTTLNAGPTEADLAETARQVEATGRRVVAIKADVRDMDAVQMVFDAGLKELGRVDIVVANAGILPIYGEHGTSRQAWNDCIDVMLTGVLNTCEAAIPTLLEQGDGGSIIITSSVAGLKGPARSLSLLTSGLLGYTAAKHGVVGVMRCYANALGPSMIRVNTIHPTGVDTPMVSNPEFAQVYDQEPALASGLGNALPVPMVDPSDVSNAVVFLASDMGRYVTGITLPVDAGATVR